MTRAVYEEVNFMGSRYKVNKYIICYFDVLGYKQRLKELGDDAYIHYMVCVINTIKTVLKSKDIVSFKYHIFSDNVIIFVPEKEDKNGNALVVSEIVKSISLLQRNLIGQYNVFIRGCITYGDLYYDGSFVFGSGLVRAYALENEIALYPRVIVDAECIKLCCKDDLLWKSIESAYLERDEDGLLFLNYLSGFRRNRPRTTQMLGEYLQYDPIDTSEFKQLPDPFHNIDFSSNERIQEVLWKYRAEYSPIGFCYLLLHKIIVERNLTEAHEGKTKWKYIWCKKYHNKICSDCGIGELLIKDI